jgi:glycerate 2-kinase
MNHNLAARVIRAALKAADPAISIARNSLSWAQDGSVKLVGKTAFVPSPASSTTFLLAAGKASVPMAASALKFLQERSSPLPIKGLVVTKTGHTVDARKEDVELLTAAGIPIREAAHPVPDERSMDAADSLMSLVKESKAEDVILVLLSGGGSSLMTLPCEGLTLADLKTTNEALLRAGCSIDEVNAVRKHLSGISGGRLAAEACKTGATLITLVLSDVVGDRLDVIASGPTVPDESTFQDCIALIEGKYPALKDTLPAVVLQRLKDGADGKIPETLKKLPEDAKDKHFVHLVGNNRLSLEAAAACLREDFSIPTLILTSTMEGEAKEVAKMLVSIAQDGSTGGWEFNGKKMLAPPSAAASIPPSSGGPPTATMPRGAALLVGGETTVNLGSATGKGGRNQEMALAAFAAWKSKKGPSDLGVLCFSTDGSDGPTDATGAFIPSCAALAEALKKEDHSRKLDPLDYLSGHDAYTFFDRFADSKEGVDFGDEKSKRSDHHQSVRIPEGAAGLIRTGGTGTNVCDLAIVYAHE